MRFTVACVPRASDELLRGVVVEKLIKNSAVDKTGIQEGDVLLHWSRRESQRRHRISIRAVSNRNETGLPCSDKAERFKQIMNLGERRPSRTLWIWFAQSGLERVTSHCVQRSSSAVARAKRPVARLLAILCLISSIWNSKAFPQQGLTPRELDAATMPGVVVEDVVHRGEGEKAGLREGDILLTWSRGDRKGDIHSPFDLAEIESEQEPLGMVKLEGLRGTEKQVWCLGATNWGLATSPNFSNSFLTSYREGQELAKLGKPEEIEKAAERWKEMARQSSNSEARWLPAWLFLHTAELLQDGKQWKEADDAYRAAIQSSAASPVVAAQLFRAWATSYRQRSDWANAEKYFQESIARSQSTGGGKFAIATNLSALGTMSWQRQDFDKAEQYQRQALEIREKLAPESLVVGYSLTNLGNALAKRGDLTSAEEYYLKSLDIQEKLAPGTLALATSLDNLGNITGDRGDLGKAEQYHRQALDIREKLAPGSDVVAASLNNLGSVAEERGDLVKAEEYYRQALEIKQKSAPGSLLVAATLNNLGLLAEQRGDLDKAEDYQRQSLVLRQTLAPGSLDVSSTLSSLGEIAYERGDLAQAEDYYHQALAIREKLAAGSLDVAACFHGLGSVAYARGDLAKAEEYFRQALSIREKLAAESLDTARSFHSLGNVAHRSADIAKAELYYRQAVALCEKLAPGSMEHAESLAALASTLRDQHNPDAAQFYAQAVSALESQNALLGGSEDVRSGFRAKHAGIYKEDIDLLLAQKQTDRAFEILELSRARTLMEMLLAAHLDIHKGADPSLLQQERSLEETRAAKSDRRLRLQGEKNNEKQVAAFTKEIEDLDKQYQEVEERLRLTSPSYAALTQPQPLSASEIQQLLDPNTLLLEYSLGDDRSYLFVVSRDALTVHELPKRAELEDQAKYLYSLLTARNRTGREKRENVGKMQARVARADSEYVKAASALSRVLLGAIEPQLGRRRLLIVADGALLYIPFAALPEPGSPGAEAAVPLMVGHELVNLPSASALAMLRRQHSPRNQPSREAVIFADPVFDGEDERVKEARNRILGDGRKAIAETSRAELPLQPSDSLTRSASDLDLLKRGQPELQRLPFTRREADAIAAVTAPHQSREALDFEASRTLAVSGELSRYRIVHFATHALVDDKHPDLSGLVLSLVDRDGHAQQGFLDLGDIYNLDLAADLVVLSACDTAVGKQVDGEGMIGLTRGFMYAGASSVMGTLWNIDDFAAAKLMKIFYTGMERNRMPPAQALREAQLALWKEKHWSAPYYWASFTLQGDWK
jgi:CHAT domain-containing protein/tetratricopeptide (TPR) repeat protein